MDDVGEEEILTRLDPEDVLRCKGVCKSWYNFISSDYFVKAHLKQSYIINPKHGDLRIRLHPTHSYNIMVGSCNGLVCISPNFPEILVTNPSTREVRKLPILPLYNDRKKVCCGFGYDSTTDDCKVVVGFNEFEHHMHFEVLSLKLNQWKFIGDYDYLAFDNQGWFPLPGILFDGALHWLVVDTNKKKKVILSFDLSLEEFKEIPQPRDTINLRDNQPLLGLFDECLCISGSYNILTNHTPIWVMKSYGCWQPLPHDYDGNKYGVATTAYILDRFPGNTWRFCDDDKGIVDPSSQSWFNIAFPIYVKSLISPYLGDKTLPIFLKDVVVQETLTRLDVEDVLRFKSVCKSWYEFISSNYFVKAHLKHSYIKNREHGDLRIRLHPKHSYDSYDSMMVGSCNGLVCIFFNFVELLVTNPFTREVRLLPMPYYENMRKLCWGFGYDSTTDDYKVVVGFNESKHHMRFQVLSLKSNKWKFIGDYDYLTYNNQSWFSRPGILFNEALHWLVDDTKKKKKVILSFDLSLEEFKEIPQPSDTIYIRNNQPLLGLFDECLCISGSYNVLTNHTHIWVMKNYGCWQLLPHDYQGNKYGVATTAYILDIYPDNTWRFCDDDDVKGNVDPSSQSWVNIAFPIFVKSLIFPSFGDQWLPNFF